MHNVTLAARPSLSHGSYLYIRGDGDRSARVPTRLAVGIDLGSLRLLAGFQYRHCVLLCTTTPRSCTDKKSNVTVLLDES